MSLQRLLELLRRLQYVLLRQHPGSPVHAKRPLALGVLENVHGVMGVRVHGTHDPPGVVGPDRYQTQVEWAPEFADLRECGTYGVVVVWAVVVCLLGELRDGSVAGVSVE